MSYWFGINDIGRIQIELTNYCNANCPQCYRDVLKDEILSGVRDKNIINSKNLDLDTIKHWFPINQQWKSLEKISLYGNIDEPTINPNLIDIIKYFSKISVNSPLINISTNGGTRDNNFWKELALETKHLNYHTIFSIDGLEDTNHIYRKNVDWQKLQSNFKTYIANGGKAIWQFIVFEHNKHQLEEAKRIAKEEGFTNFKLVQSIRKPKKQIVTKLDVFKKNEKKEVVNCCAKLNSNSYKFHETKGNIYINIDGYVVPCCWMGTNIELESLWNRSKVGPALHSLQYYPIEEILSQNMWSYLHLEQQKYPLCIKKCKELVRDEQLYINKSN